MPEPTKIRFRRDETNVVVEMTPEAVCANMQTNEAAFESWSLALRLWLHPMVLTVTLHWTPPPIEGDDLNPHYSRFLYRVQRFAGLFPDWFKIGNAEHLEACKVRGKEALYLNVAGATSNEPALRKRETDVERELTSTHQELMMQMFLLKNVDRQFPVGVYRSPDLKGRVFTAGTSAIDIIGTSPEAVSVFELKAGKNIDIGGLGELLFYASVIRDAAGPNARFQFGNAKSAVSRSCIETRDVQNAKAVRAFFLAENFHPLLEHPLLVNTLNEAAAKQVGNIPLTVEAFRLSGFDEKRPRFKRFAA